MIDIRKLKELVRLMVANELSELDLRDSEEQVTLRRGPAAGSHGMIHGSPPPPQTGSVAAVPVAAPAAVTAAAPPSDDEGLHIIKSPMVGTYYAAPNPDSGPFVTVGAAVDPDAVVCIIEAMKIFNEIRAECSGTVEKILVKNGDSLEFGQPLFAVRPS